MTEANYADIHSSNYSSHGWTQLYKTDNKYQEKVSYDLRGNITALERNGLTSNCMTYNGFVGGLWGKIDNLTYTYDPADLNKLTKVTDAADLTRGFKSVNNNTTYTYDANGNLTSDLNKNITSITYNYLNLPLVISFTGNNRIEFIYDATGAKLRKTTYANNTLQETRDYVNGVEYKGGVVDRFAHTEGSVVNQAGSYVHEYTIKDHLGNARVTYSDGNNDGIVTVADIKQINHYYPFGMNMEGNWNGSFSDAKNKYQYNGKEWNDDFGLGLNDYGARFYDSAVDRWWSVDPESESGEQPSFNPYHYVYDNPIKNIDPDGREGEGCCGAQEITAGLIGVTVGVVDNLLGSNLREEVGSKMFGNGGLRDSYNAGLDVADKGSLVAGATMVVGGGVIAGGGAAVSTTGVGAIAGVPTIAVGLGTSAAGAFVFRNAAKNLQNSQAKAKQNDDSNLQSESGKEKYSKKEARNEGKEQRANQPASENYVKHKAKEVEKSKGKDARRKAHDAKKNGEGDRTKERIDKDYKL